MEENIKQFRVHRVERQSLSENDADANELTARLNSLDCHWRSRGGEPHRCFGD
jgi:hypothetical protein